MDQDDFHLEEWLNFRDRLKRQFTIQCKDQCELLTLSIHDLNIMKNEFKEAYNNIFENSFTHLRRTIQVKLKAIKYSNKYLMSENKKHMQASVKKMFTFSGEQLMSKKLQDLNFEPIEQNEIEEYSSNFDSSSDDSPQSYILSSDSISDDDGLEQER